mmetsp:Transcript_1275/g.1443  ORF Transcript_1275/g.1443 Transcript_1275/m.1443 type:complete len:117 (+) Transcript_1275:65-415(+)
MATRPVWIHEINAKGVGITNGSSVRVLGRLQSVNNGDAKALIEYNNNRLWVDTSNLSSEQTCLLTPGMLLQFLGTVHYQGANVHLKAQVLRNATGMDCKLYKESIERTRQYFSVKA